MTKKSDSKIENPPTGFMDKFRSKRPPTIAGVETVLTALPILRVGEARDFFRVHPDEDNYASPELCFVHVPIKGVKNDVMHLIDEEIAVEHLSAAQISAAAIGPGIEASRCVVLLVSAHAEPGQPVECERA